MDQAVADRTQFAHLLANASRSVIRPYFRRRIELTDKGKAGFYDPVTEADRKAEEAIRELIGTHYPNDAILGEELGEKEGSSGFRWVLDPIDGTRAFIAGQPLWGTLIGLERHGVPLVGVLDQPFLDERFVGTSSETLLVREGTTEKMATRACVHLGAAVICTTHPMTHFSEDERARYLRVEKACLLSRYGGDCYGYALLAMGFIDLVIETDLKRWDVSALIPIVQGAGGIVSDWHGRPILDGGNIVAAGDARVHAEALNLLNA
jgi:histidinol-phosphatase